MSSYTGRHVERLIRAVTLWRILVAAIEKPAELKLLTWKRLQCAKDGLTVLTARNVKSAIHEVALHEGQTTSSERGNYGGNYANYGDALTKSPIGGRLVRGRDNNRLNLAEQQELRERVASVCQREL